MSDKETQIRIHDIKKIKVAQKDIIYAAKSGSFIFENRTIMIKAAVIRIEIMREIIKATISL